MDIYHDVNKGESLYSIAMHYGVPPCLILRHNHLRSVGECRPGRKLKIPVQNGWEHMPLPEQRLPRVAVQPLDSIDSEQLLQLAQKPFLPMLHIPEGRYFIGENVEFARYMIRPGDTVYSLAQRFYTTPQNILIANGIITPNLLIVGRILRIPLPPSGAVLYTVKPGDTLYKIAQELNVPMENITNYNYLNRDGLIFPGQQLVVKEIR